MRRTKKDKEKEIKSNFLNGTKDLDVYKRGAFVGGIIGGCAGLIIGRKIILSILGGAIVGGYISFQINKDSGNTFNLKKFRNIKTDLKTETDGE